MVGFQFSFGEEYHPITIFTLSTLASLDLFKREMVSLGEDDEYLAEVGGLYGIRNKGQLSNVFLGDLTTTFAFTDRDLKSFLAERLRQQNKIRFAVLNTCCQRLKLNPCSRGCSCTTSPEVVAR